MPRELARRGESLPIEAYELMDDADTELIISSLAGKTLDRYVYYLPDIKAYGLSVNGVADACRYMAQHGGEFIRVEDMPQVIVDEKGCLANVIARRYVKETKTGNLICADTALGTKYELRNPERRDGSTWKNKHFREVAVSKAERNAKNKLILEEIKVKLIEKYKKMTGKTGELDLSRKQGPINKQPNNIKMQQLKRELIDLAVWKGDSDYRNFLEKNFAGDHGEPIRSSKQLSDIQKTQAIDMMLKLKENKPERGESGKDVEELLLKIRQLKQALGEEYIESVYRNISQQGAKDIIHRLEAELRKKEGQ